MEKYLTPEQTAELAGTTKAALAQLRYTGGGPTFRRPTPRKIVYLESDVRAWLEGNAFTRTDQPLASPAA